MPLVKKRCERCGELEVSCPECGSKYVTPLDNPQAKKPTEMAIYGGDEEEYTNVCWDCGWKETVTVKIERE